MQKKLQIAAWILLISAALLILFEGNFYLKDALIWFLVGIGAVTQIASIFWPSSPTTAETNEGENNHWIDEEGVKQPR